MEGWKLWHALAGIQYSPRHKPVHLPDANSRLQAVISGNAIALLDELAKPEIDDNLLAPLSEICLEGYDYYLIPSKSQRLSSAATCFSLIVILLIFFTDFLTITSEFFEPGIDPFK